MKCCGGVSASEIVVFLSLCKNSDLSLQETERKGTRERDKRNRVQNKH